MPSLSVIPPALRRLSSDEYRPLRWTERDLRVIARLQESLPVQARALNTNLWGHAESRRGTAATLRAINAAHDEEFYQVPVEAEMEDAAAAETFSAGDVVIDVQTHLVRPSKTSTMAADGLYGFLRMADPERWAVEIDPTLISAPQWASLIFGQSETAVALLTSLPGPPEDNVLTNVEIAAAREIVARYAGSGRVLTHTIVHPNLGTEEIEAMKVWRDELRPSGWKVYTLWEPFNPEAPEVIPSGWFLDDEEVGVPFLEQVRAIGPKIVCAHKGIGGPLPNLAPAGSSPRDVGPAAARFPDITFMIYHSGYDPDEEGEEGPHRQDPQRGVSRLVSSLEEAGLEPGSNVYAELGSTWFLMLRRPREAAHVLGKLLMAVGPDRIVWGTDSIWYGSPQFLIDSLRAFQIPESMQEEFGYPALTEETKAKILGQSAAEVYGIDLAWARGLADEHGPSWLEDARNELLSTLS
jgi:predicted TIM-barrel fold metal-dependent hydrolase